MSMQKLGQYAIIKEVGRGGMATVYLARDQANNRQVALKVLPKQFTHDPQFRGRFEREAQVLARIRHPYIVPVYDFGQVDDQPYLVMHYLGGGTLAERMGTRAMPLAEVLPIAKRLADALDSVHKMGIVHRDLKPGNILLDEKGQAYLTDFGIIKLAEETAAYTQTGMIVGTPKYMSPEQAMGQGDVEYHSDLYTFAVILYEMLAGQHPFATTGDTPVGMMLKHVSDPPPTLETARLKLPARCNAILMRGLAKRPTDRYASASELVQALASAQAAAQEVIPAAIGQGKELAAMVCVQCNAMGLELQDDGKAACRFCGTINAIGGTICAECEFVNPPDEVYCLACRRALTHYCPACQANNWSGAEYCAVCGEPLDALSYLNERWGQQKAGGQRMSANAYNVQALKAAEAEAAERRRAELEAVSKRYNDQVRASAQRRDAQQQQMLIVMLVGLGLVVLVLIVVLLIMMANPRG